MSFNSSKLIDSCLDSSDIVLVTIETSSTLEMSSVTLETSSVTLETSSVTLETSSSSFKLFIS